MIRKSFFLIFFSSLGLAQQADLPQQFRLILSLLPESTRVGILHPPDNSALNAVQKAAQDTGIRAYTAEVKTIRDISQACRSLNQYEVDFVFLIEDRSVTGTNAIRFVVKQMNKRQIPVFTTSDNAFKGNAFGWLVQNGSAWKIKINTKTRSRFNIEIPESNKFSIE